MQKQTIRRLTVVVPLCFVVPFAAAAALDDYVARPDPAYRYSLERTVPGPGMTGYILNMTSQTWRTSAEVNRTEWQHWVQIVVPEAVQHSKALLVISGGSNGRPTPTNIDGTAAALARETGTIVAVVQMIPNEPLQFADESRDRSEDAIIAYSWDKCMKTGDETWILQLPMVKSAVRAMDTVQAFVAQLPGNRKIDGFFVTGGSKRGWTTWLTGAVDKRVFGIAPLVIDMLNTQKSFVHHRRVYGFYAPAVHDYEEMGIFDRMLTPEADKLMAIVDPLKYRDRLTMPKCIVNGSGDQFFLPDSWRFYFHQLQGVKQIRYAPNAGHGLEDSGVVEAVGTFYLALLNGWKLPDWEFDQTIDSAPEVIRARTRTRPRQVLLWQGTNPNARDFRVDVLGKVWKSTELSAAMDGEVFVYRGEVAKPEKGFTAFFIEATFDSPGKYPFKFTTGVHIVPDVEPFACDLDWDGAVGGDDVGLLASCWLGRGRSLADVAPGCLGDEAVDLLDLSILSRTFGNAN